MGAVMVRRRASTVRKVTRASDKRGHVQVDGLDIDLVRRRVLLQGTAVDLTPTEMSLLYLLALYPGQVLSREEILDAVWGADYIADSNVVDAQVRLLRLLLRCDPRQPRYIETVAGKGYRFITRKRA